MSQIGRPVEELDSPQLLLDLDVLDANLRRMQEACRQRGVVLRAFQIAQVWWPGTVPRARGVVGFLCAKLNEAEVLVAAGIDDIFLANQIVGPRKLQRLANLRNASRYAFASMMPKTSTPWVRQPGRPVWCLKC